LTKDQLLKLAEKLRRQLLLVVAQRDDFRERLERCEKRASLKNVRALEKEVVHWQTIAANKEVETVRRCKQLCADGSLLIGEKTDADT
jgi:hypothetical protein